MRQAVCRDGVIARYRNLPRAGSLASARRDLKPVGSAALCRARTVGARLSLPGTGMPVAGTWPVSLLCPWLCPGSRQTSERAAPRFIALGHGNAALAGLTSPLKNALEAGRQSSHTAARPVSQSSAGTIRASTVAPNTEWITEYTWPPMTK